MPPAITAAIIGGGAVLGASAISSSAAKKATQSQVGAQRQSLAFQKQLLRQLQQRLKPLGGLQALTQARKLLRQGPGELSPQQEREFGRGIEALQAGFSRTSGGGVSSRALERAQQFGQDFAARRLDEELNRLLPFIDLAFRARAGSSGLSLAPSVASTFGNIGQAQGIGALAQGNIQSNTLQSLFGQGGIFSNLLSDAPQQQQLFSGTGFGPFGSSEGQAQFGPQFT